MTKMKYVAQSDILPQNLVYGKKKYIYCGKKRYLL